MAVRPHALQAPRVRHAGVASPVVVPEAGAPRHVARHASPRPPLRLVAPPSGRPGMAFVVLSALAVGALVLGIVVLNVLVAQKAFRLGDLNRAVQREEARSQQLRYAVASADAPEAIAEAARRLGLVAPARQEFLVRPADDAAARDAGPGQAAGSGQDARGEDAGARRDQRAAR